MPDISRRGPNGPVHPTSAFVALIPLTALATALALAAPTPALADPDSRRRATLPPAASATSSSHGDVTTAAKKNVASQSGPQLSADDILAIQRQVHPIRRQQIELLEKLLAETPPGNASERGEIAFRIAEMYSQQARFHRFRAMELDRALASAARAKRATLRRRIGTHRAEAKQRLADAVRYYRRFIDERALLTHARRPEALARYAYTLGELGDGSGSRRVYHLLVRDHPSAPQVADAYMAFADYYFEAGSLANAERFYDKVLLFADYSLRDFARYKRGWVYVNQSRSADALEAFFQVAQATRRVPRERALYRAATGDFVRVYAEIGKTERAYNAFRRVADDDRAFEMLQRLADVYLSRGQGRKAVYTLRDLIRRAPDHDQVCTWQRGVVEAMTAMGDKQRIVTEIDRLVALYRDRDRRRALRADALSECRTAAADAAGTTARLWHAEANKTRADDVLALAERLYKLYLDAFPAAADRAETRFFYAELLWMRADWQTRAEQAAALWARAAAAHTEVAQDAALDPARRRESAYAAVLGWQKAASVRGRQGLPPPVTETPDQTPAPLPIPDEQRRMLDAFAIYLAQEFQAKANARSDDWAGIQFLAGRTYFAYRHYDEAIPLLAAVLTERRDHETAGWAAQLLLDSLILTRREADLRRWLRELASDRAFADEHGQVATRVDTLSGQVERKRLERLEATGDRASLLACGQGYLALYRGGPGAADAPELLYNAAVCFERVRSLGAAIELLEHLRAAHPDNPLAKRAIARVGAAYARVGFYRDAAGRFEEYGRRFGGEADAQDALSDAVFYYRGVGDHDRALRLIRLFADRYRRADPAAVGEALWAAVAIHAQRGDDDQEIRALRRYLAHIGPSAKDDASATRRIAALTRLGQAAWRRSCPVAGHRGACVRVRRAAQRGDAGAARTHCGPESLVRVQVVDRDRRDVAAAHRALREAIALAEARARATAKTAAGRAASPPPWIRHEAAARLTLAEAENEAFLALGLPTRLDFDPRRPAVRKRSLDRFSAWLTDKQARATRAARAYEAAARVGDPRVAIASAARVGQISQSFADLLLGAPIPPYLRRGQFADDAVDSYCDELANRARPLEDLALRSFAACLDTSKKLSVFDDWSRVCERELGERRPTQYPRTHEHHAAPDRIAPIIDRDRVPTLASATRLSAARSKARSAGGS